MSEKNRQIQFAQDLADDLEGCGHDISAPNLLDCLASCGLRLQKDKDGRASDAYFESLG